MLPERVFVSINNIFFQFTAIFLATIDRQVDKTIIHLTMQADRTLQLSQVETFHNRPLLEAVLKTCSIGLQKVIVSCREILASDDPRASQFQFNSYIDSIYD